MHSAVERACHDQRDRRASALAHDEELAMTSLRALGPGRHETHAILEKMRLHQGRMRWLQNLMKRLVGRSLVRTWMSTTSDEGKRMRPRRFYEVVE